VWHYIPRIQLGLDHQREIRDKLSFITLTTGRQLFGQLLQKQLHHRGGLELQRTEGQARRGRHHTVAPNLRRLSGFISKSRFRNGAK